MPQKLRPIEIGDLKSSGKGPSVFGYQNVPPLSRESKNFARILPLARTHVERLEPDWLILSYLSDHSGFRRTID